jgi:hypothetical protein
LNLLIVLSENKTIGNPEFLADSEILIIDVPPKLRGSETENFVFKIRNIIPFIEKSAVQKCFSSVQPQFIMMSMYVTEETIARPATERETITGNRTTIAKQYQF